MTGCDFLRRARQWLCTWPSLEEWRLVEKVCAPVRGKRYLLVCDFAIHLPLAVVAHPPEPTLQYAIHVVVVLREQDGRRDKRDSLLRGQ